MSALLNFMNYCRNLLVLHVNVLSFETVKFFNNLIEGLMELWQFLLYHSVHCSFTKCI